MPFRLINALATFQVFISITFCEYLDIFVIAYLDDILIYIKKTLEKYIQSVRKNFKALKRADIGKQLDKYEFHVKEVKYLGSVIKTNRIYIDEKKVKVIKVLPESKNLKEV